MPAKALDGRQSKRVIKGHGQRGFVQLSATIPPLMKSALVRRARRKGTSLNDEVRVAIARYLEDQPN
jgi:hypothetical protein